MRKTNYYYWLEIKALVASAIAMMLSKFDAWPFSAAVRADTIAIGLIIGVLVIKIKRFGHCDGPCLPPVTGEDSDNAT